MADARNPDRNTHSHTVFTVRDHSPLTAILGAFARYRVKVLVVVNEAQNAVGIIHEREVAKRLAEDAAALERTAAEIMTRIVHAAPYLRVSAQSAA